MRLVDGFSSGATVATPAILGAFLFFIMMIGVAWFVVTRRRKAAATAEARRAEFMTLREVPPACRLDGHAYKRYVNGWRCSACGNYRSHQEGEQYGLTQHGRIDRRRHPR